MARLHDSRPWRLAAAAVHLLTASGAVLGLLALLAAARQDLAGAFAWLGLALIVDGIDGPLARRVGVERALPRFGGDRLDLVVDYLNYCLVPAFMIATASLVPDAMAWALGAAIALTSLFQFADRESKTGDGCFVGFPAIWNVVVFYLFVLDVRGWPAAFVVAVFCVLTFVPMRWPHPLRTARLRPATIAVLVAWSVAAVAAVVAGEPAPGWARLVFVLAALYAAGLLAARALLGPARSQRS